MGSVLGCGVNNIPVNFSVSYTISLWGDSNIFSIFARDSRKTSMRLFWPLYRRKRLGVPPAADYHASYIRAGWELLYVTTEMINFVWSLGDNVACRIA